MPEPSGAPKPVHTLILDAGPLIRNSPPVSTLLAQSESLLTTPAVISEIRDPAARTRIENLYLPFVTQRSPKPESFKFVSEFARKTGDRAVLSRTDLEIIALAYEVECERNHGDWRLRREPGQKGINGAPPPSLTGGKKNEESEGNEKEAGSDTKQEAGKDDDIVEAVTEDLKSTTLENGESQATVQNPTNDETAETEENDPDTQPVDSDSDGGEWITPSNIKKKQARDEAGSEAADSVVKTMQVATMTTDFAMQNVLLQMNLNILSDRTLQRISHLKSYILRCHGCFLTTKEMDKQFCPRCGKPTLTRVSCTTNSSGTFKLHLKKNKQWNTRGDRFSIPKPVGGSSNGKWKGGGGQGGWGSDLILAEDQKEYVRAVADEGRRTRHERDLMDADYLPDILTGQRHKSGKIKVGAGRNINSRKRR